MIYTAQDIRRGTGFARDARFIAITAVELDEIRRWHAADMHHIDALYQEANDTCTDEDYRAAEEASDMFNGTACEYLQKLLGLEA
jgi:hypothetical protein